MDFSDNVYKFKLRNVEDFFQQTYLYFNNIISNSDPCLLCLFSLVNCSL